MNEEFPKPGSRIKNIEGKENLTTSFGAESIPSIKHPEVNEDNILTSSSTRTFGVFDGMGGHAAGDVASKLARDYASISLYKIKNGMTLEEAERALVDIVVGANRAIQDAAFKNPEQREMGTTGSILRIHTDNKGSNFAVIANVGDSRVYRLVEGNLQQLTEDDDAVGNIFDEKERERVRSRLANARKLSELSEEEKYYFQTRNQIYKSLGSGSTPKISTFGVEKGHRYLLTSDGIHDNLTTDEIREILEKNPDEKVAANKLIEAATIRSQKPRGEEMRAKADDMTAIVVRVD